MHVLRCSLHTPPLGPGDLPTTIIVRDVDVTVSPEQWAERMTADAAPIFITTAVYELEGDDLSLEAAVAHGTDQMRERVHVEQNMAIAYYWFTHSFSKIAPGGTVAQKDPAPFGVEDAKTVLRQIGAHPAWQQQTVYIIADDGEFVVLKPDGSVAVGGTWLR